MSRARSANRLCDESWRLVSADCCKGVLVDDETALPKNKMRSAVPDNIRYGELRTSRTEATPTPPSGRAFIDRDSYLREPWPEDRSDAVPPESW